MSEIINDEVQTPEMELANVVKSHVEEVAATKADKADLEGFATTEAIETKAAALESVLESKASEETVAELKSALEAMEAKLDAMPVAVTEEKSKMTQTFYFDAPKEETVTKSFNILKAELTPNNVADSPVGTSPIWTVATEMNPFRGIANVFPVNSASFKTFELTSVDANKNENAGSQTEGGAVGNGSVNVNDYNSLTRMNENLVDDLPGLDAMVGMEQARKVMLEEHKDIVSVLNAATFGTDTNADISDDALATLAPYQALIAAVPNVNWTNASWVMSNTAYTKLLDANHSGTGSPLVIDPVSGGFTLYGRPIYVSGEMDSGSAAGDHPVYYGDFGRALWIGTRQDMQFRRSYENTIGAVTYYTNMRSGQAAVDTSAVRRLAMVA